jgi:hypothetical protein
VLVELAKLAIKLVVEVKAVPTESILINTE